MLSLCFIPSYSPKYGKKDLLWLFLFLLLSQHSAEHYRACAHLLFPVISVSTTVTPAPVISGCTGCPPSDRNSCAYLSEQKDRVANGSGLRLMALFTEDKDQRSVCSLSSKAIFFPEKKKFILCQFLREGSGWYFLVTEK